MDQSSFGIYHIYFVWKTNKVSKVYVESHDLLNIIMNKLHSL